MGILAVILLDTHVLVWMVADSKRLSRPAATAIRRAQDEGGVAISAITLWELASLIARGRIPPEIAALTTLFPETYPRDPADRLIGATALAEGMHLITRDANIRKSPLLTTIW